MGLFTFVSVSKHDTVWVLFLFWVWCHKLVRLLQFKNLMVTSSENKMWGKAHPLFCINLIFH